MANITFGADEGYKASFRRTAARSATASLFSNDTLLWFARAAALTMISVVAMGAALLYMVDDAVPNAVVGLVHVLGA